MGVGWYHAQWTGLSERGIYHPPGKLFVYNFVSKKLQNNLLNLTLNNKCHLSFRNIVVSILGILH